MKQLCVNYLVTLAGDNDKDVTFVCDDEQSQSGNCQGDKWTLYTGSAAQEEQRFYTFSLVCNFNFEIRVSSFVRFV